MFRKIVLLMLGCERFGVNEERSTPGAAGIDQLTDDGANNG